MGILISGANGFVGSHLSSELNDFEIFDRKSKNILDFSSWLSYGEKEYLIFLSARTSISDSWENPYLTYTDNTQALHTALEYCRKCNVKLIYFSSFVYKIKREGIYNESDTIKAYNPYALSKISSEKLIQFYCSNFNMDAVILRPFNIYGQGQNNSFLIPHIYEEINKGGDIELKSLTPIRDYIYIKDVVNAVKVIINSSLKGLKTYNLSTGIGTSVGELISKISNVTGKEYNIKEIGEQPYQNNIEKAVGDNSLFRADYKWEPKFDLIRGIKDFNDLYFKK